MPACYSQLLSHFVQCPLAACFNGQELERDLYGNSKFLMISGSRCLGRAPKQDVGSEIRLASLNYRD